MESIETVFGKVEVIDLTGYKRNEPEKTTYEFAKLYEKLRKENEIDYFKVGQVG